MFTLIVKMSILTDTKRTFTPTFNNIEDDAVLTSSTNILKQLRADSEYDEDDDALTTKPKPTGSPPPVTVTISNSPGINEDINLNHSRCLIKNINFS